MLSWKEIIRRVLSKPPHKDIKILKNNVKHPLEEGFIETIGEPRGQLKDYEYILSDGRRIHVREYFNHYEAHWDYVSPRINPIEHLRRDTPHWWIFIWFGFGIIYGYLISKDLNKAFKEGIKWSMVGIITTIF